MLAELDLQAEALNPEFSERAALPVCLPPWRENPYRLVSLWDLVKDFHASELLASVRLIINTAGICFDSPQNPGYHLAQVANLAKELGNCQTICERLDLPMSALHASQLKKQVEEFAVMMDTKVTERMAATLGVTIENELSLRAFFAVSPEKTKFYNDTVDPFGAVVSGAFPSASFDATEANRCYALSRSTACVFHLMRVLEIGLTVFATRFNVPSSHTNWHNIIEGIEKAVRDMPNDPQRSPDWKDQQEFFSQAASYFMIVKDAWRNYTAHMRGKYTEEEAETMLINVRGFMQKLATRLHE
jgi:hypothetical protein